jgi:hypothetical protein
MKTSKMLITGIVGLIVLVVAYVAYAYFANGIGTAVASADQTPIDTTISADQAKGTPSITPVSTVPASTPAPVANASKYKDGTYSATGTYRTPESVETINVTLTLANDVVTDVTSTISASAPESAQYQRKFLSNYKALVVGRSIDSLKLSQVSGSSLTSGGFNSALSQIKTKAIS